MAKKIGVAAISTGEYQKDGQTKKKWLNIGVVFDDGKGNMSIKFEVLPVPTPQKDGYPAAWVKIFLDGERTDHPQSTYTPRNEYHQQQKQNAYQPQQQQESRYSPEENEEDNIPF